MQPYGGTEFITTSEVPAERAHPFARLRNRDLLNIIAILFGWGLLLLLVPPQHEYPIIDDWVYYNSVKHMLATGTFILPDSQANLAGLTVWGAAWSRLFGLTFTTLTYSTLVMALACLLFFYGIARAVNVPPWGALLGTALLAINPIFFHLSYSFMTDVPFLALVLGSCYCYLRALQTEGKRAVWFVAGGFLAGWAYVIRQFGILVPLSFGAYFILGTVITRKLRWREIIGMALIPALFLVGWYFFSRDMPAAPSAVAAQGRAARYVMQEPWLRVILLRAFTILPLAALFAWGAVRMRRIAWLLVIPSIFLLAGAAYAVDLPEETWLPATEPSFTARFGPLAFDHPNEAYTFGNHGNIVRTGGIDFFEYDQERIWTQEAWRLLWAIGAVLAVILLVKAAESFLDWLKEVRREKALSPLLALYLLGTVIFLLSIAVTGDLFDRYSLAFLPFLILFVVRGTGEWGRIAWAYSIAALLLLSTFTVLAKLDQIDHNNARWEAAYWMKARTGAVHVGYDWDIWTGVGSATYWLADVPLNSFRVEQAFPYRCRLCGFTTRYVLAQARVEAPPLPQPTPTP